MEAVIADRNALQKYVWQRRIVQGTEARSCMTAQGASLR
jgi:hypothetical protein